MSTALGSALGITGIVIVGAALLLLLYVIGTYNGLVSRRLGVSTAWAQIDVQLKRRYDLIPNLVETVRGYAAHEKETLDRVISARNQAAGATGPAQAAAAEGILGGALRQLFAVAEAYPNLKANENFNALQSQLADTENQIGGVRAGYNRAVQDYNTAIATFPAVVVATMLGFQPEHFFEITETTQREAPKVKFT